jgi:hypothetical protein
LQSSTCFHGSSPPWSFSDVLCESLACNRCLSRFGCSLHSHRFRSPKRQCWEGAIEDCERGTGHEDLKSHLRFRSICPPSSFLTRIQFLAPWYLLPRSFLINPSTHITVI